MPTMSTLGTYGRVHSIGEWEDTREHVWQCHQCGKFGGLNAKREMTETASMHAAWYRLREHLIRRCASSNLEPEDIDRA